MNAWEQQEPGWWTHPLYGGVCRERDGKWHIHPLNSPPLIGGLKTMKDAMATAEFGFRRFGAALSAREPTTGGEHAE